jgi:hypothetical protein
LEDFTASAFLGYAWAFLDIWKSYISHIFKDVEIEKEVKN